MIPYAYMYVFYVFLVVCKFLSAMGSARLMSKYIKIIIIVIIIKILISLPNYR